MTTMIPTDARIYVAGHTGLVGSAIVRALRRRGHEHLILRTHAELELTDAAAVATFFVAERPELVFMAAARVGGIAANRAQPAQFLLENLQIQNAVIHAAYTHGVRKLLFLGSSCMYPRACQQPMGESLLLTGALEPTNEPYAIAKIAGMKLCESHNQQYGTSFVGAVPASCYGPGDHFSVESSHVVPALIRKLHDAKERRTPTVTLWGTGSAIREFLHVDDCADACCFLMEHFAPRPDASARGGMFCNVGTGIGTSIRTLAATAQRIIGYEGEIVWDRTKPDGMPVKLVDVQQLHALGWRHTIALEHGLRATYAWFVEHTVYARTT